jgi:hypothetical protein
MQVVAAAHKGRPLEIQARRAGQRSYSAHTLARYSVFRRRCWECQRLWQMPGPAKKARQTVRRGLRVSATRQGVTGTKLKPVSAEFPMNVAEAVFSAPSSREVIVGAAPEGAGVAVDEGLGTGVRVAEGWIKDVGMGLDVPPMPPHPAKENTMRDKQINEEIPKTQNERWRRIDYLSAIQR